ncbi:hypothetical protein [Agrobacterium burrii]
MTGSIQSTFLPSRRSWIGEVNGVSYGIIDLPAEAGKSPFCVPAGFCV